MPQQNITLVGAPVQSGASQPGCNMGPDALRAAGLGPALQSLGYPVSDFGNLSIATQALMHHSNARIHGLAETVAWAQTLKEVAFEIASQGDLPIFMGGDHSLSIGTVAGVAQFHMKQNRPLFVLWLDAHPDIHSLESTESGNLHGTPVAYFTGKASFKNIYPELTAVLPSNQVCMMGIRSVDMAERAHLQSGDIEIHDMRAIDETGIRKPILAFLERVKAANGVLHVSLDVDFLDPNIAPAVGTTVPGGATFREAHLVMETLCESGVVRSLDLVELNPFLDIRGRTARLIVDLCASLMGRTVLDRKTRSY
ncbi:MAG: arginase [Pseudomonadota bacterium]